MAAVSLSLDMQYLQPDLAGGRLLGAVRYGHAGPLEISTGLAVPLRCLESAPVCWTSWLGQAPIAQGRLGQLQYRHNQDLLFGHIQLREADFAGQTGASALQAASHAGYQAIFDALHATGFTHLVRCWNYLPDINADGGGLERYRQFNIGRQDAFATSPHASLEAAPAASALGTPSGDLSIYFLASHTPAVALENPRQVPAYRYPSQYGPRTPIFSRGGLLSLAHSETLFISGTASILGHESVHPGKLAEQTEETLRNIAAVVAAANARAISQPFTCEELTLKVFVRHAVDLPQIRQIIDRQWGSAGKALFLQADVCRAELLVEIEAFCSHCRETS
jgi:chorismate lyase / 3-hydroxybenzoate synthase